MDKALCIISGRMACDPDMKATATNRKVCRWAVAVNTPRGKDKDDVSFFECIAWEDQAKDATRFRKGQNVEVLGAMYVDKYTDGKGQNRSITMIRVEKMYWVNGFQKENDAAEKRSRRAAANIDEFEEMPTATEDVTAEGDDDLPF